MTATFEESVLDFDINFLHPSTNNETRIDKQRKAIIIAKKKIIATDSLIRKYYANKEKLDQNEVVLLTAKEECKQVCIDYKEALEKCTQLEKNLNSLKNENAELNTKFIVSQNQYEGMKSHANQLQLLVKDHELAIEALNVEKNLDIKSNPEDHKKNLSSIQRENEVLLKHLSLIKDIALGKKKLRDRHKVILQKYDHLKQASSDDDSSSESSCVEPDFFDDDPASPLFAVPEDSVADKPDHTVFKPNNLEIGIKNDSTRLNEDNYSDCSNEVVSEDTGRGSSLAFSDGEKCFNSPDYFNTDSSTTTEAGKINVKAIVIDSSKSPSRTNEAVHVATSPLIFDDEPLLMDDNMLFRDETNENQFDYFIADIPLSDEIITIKEKRKLVNIGTSPIRDIEKVNIATSPVSFKESITLIEKEALNPILIAKDIEKKQINSNCDVNNFIPCEESPCIIIEDTSISVKGKHTTIDNLTSYCELEISGKMSEEKECLEKNNSINMCDENSNDGEIEMILNSMRLSQRFLTPIPKTPIVIKKNESRKQDNPRGHDVCRESSILRQENKALQTSVADLRKDIMDIKNLLKNHLLIHEQPKDQLSNVKENSLNDVIFDDSSQESLFIYTNNNNSSVQDEETRINNFNVLSEEATLGETDEENNNDIVQSELFADTISAPQLQNVAQVEFEGEETRDISENNIVDIPINDSREALTYEEDLRKEDESDIIKNVGVDLITKDLPRVKEKIIKHKKLSKLDKFKHKLLPKCKISTADPIRKLRSKSKVLPVTKINSHMNAIAILNNKSAYENAAKVMAELKSNNKNSANKIPTKKTTRKTHDEKKDELIKIKLTDTYSERQPEGSETNEHYPVCLSKLKPDIEQAKQQQVYDDKYLDSIEDDIPLSEFTHITTRSRSLKLNNDGSISPIQVDSKQPDTKEIHRSEERRKRLKRVATDSPVVASKRVLRSSSIRDTFVDLDSVKEVISNDNAKGVFDTLFRSRDNKLSNGDNGIQKERCQVNKRNTSNIVRDSKLMNDEPEKQITKDDNTVNKSGDRRLSSSNNGKENEIENLNNISNTPNKTRHCKLSNVEIEKHNIQVEVVNKSGSEGDQSQINHPKQSILCKMIEKYGRTGNYSCKKVPDNASNSICKKLESSIALINDLPTAKINPSMNKLVDEIQGWNVKHFMAGFMKYLKEPARKRELFKTVNSPPAPPMTKSEQVLLYVVRQMEMRTPNTVTMILSQIEFTLFQLNRTPEFDVIDSVSHFYALLCRYFGLKRRLRLFLLDAMYCLRFKVVPLIKQCLDVWMHILPLAHMGIAKSPLVICLVYLLHFYKCEDKFNRIQEIRFILSRKYFYQITDWTEAKILEMFKHAIREVREIVVEKKMLRMALIILGKRQGPKWCHKNIIKAMLMPMIESNDVSMSKKQFCVEMIGALLKPFPADMKVHYEIAVNYLLDMLQQNPPDSMKEVIFTSLIYVNYHNPNRVIQLLLSWMPKKVSPDFEKLMRDYVRAKTVGGWKKILSRVSM